MGANVSKTVNDTVNETLVTAVNKTLNQFSSDTENKNSINQVRKLNMSGATLNLGNGCTFDARQEAAIQSEVIANLDAETQTALSNYVLNDVMAALEKKLKQENKDFNFLQFNVSSSLLSAKNRFETELENIIHSTISAQSKSLNDIFQNDDLDFSGIVINCEGGSINLSQVAKIVSSLESNEDFTSVSSAYNEAKNSLISNLNEEISQSNIGINPFIIGIIIVIIVALLIFGGVWGTRKFRTGQGIELSRMKLITTGIVFLMGIAFILAGNFINQQKITTIEQDIQQFDVDRLQPYAEIDASKITETEMRNLKPGDYLPQDAIVSIRENRPIKEADVITRITFYPVREDEKINWYVQKRGEEIDRNYPTVMVGDIITKYYEDLTPLNNLKLGLTLGGVIICMFSFFFLLSKTRTNVGTIKFGKRKYKR